MNQEFRLLFIARHTAKGVYCCMSKYHLTKHTITNVKHLLIRRYVQHMSSTLQTKR